MKKLLNNLSPHIPLPYSFNTRQHHTPTHTRRPMPHRLAIIDQLLCLIMCHYFIVQFHLQDALHRGIDSIH